LRLRRRRRGCRSGSGVYQRRVRPRDVHGRRSGSLDKGRTQDERRFVACRGHPVTISTIHSPSELSDGLTLSLLRLARYAHRIPDTHYGKVVSRENHGDGPSPATAREAVRIYFSILGGAPRSNPAFSRASTIFSTLVFSSSKVTMAMCEYSLTSDFSTFATFLRVQLTLSLV
jgi:hypothetical protein